MTSSQKRLAARIYSKLGTNVPYTVPTKCCYFLCRSKIQNGHPGIWLANTFSTSKNVAVIYPNLGTNVPYGIPSKCCYFLCRTEIQYGHPGLWLADTLLTSSQEQLQPQGSTSILAQIFLMESRPSVITFYVDVKSKMAALASDWLTYKKLIIIKTFCF